MNLLVFLCIGFFRIEQSYVRCLQMEKYIAAERCLLLFFSWDFATVSQCFSIFFSIKSSAGRYCLRFLSISCLFFLSFSCYRLSLIEINLD